MTQKKMRVLLIEDDADDVFLLKESLAGNGETQVEFMDADRLSHGLNQLAEKVPDIVLLDLNLPDSCGLDTLTTFLNQAPKMPVVVLSGLNDYDRAIEAVKLGAQDYLVKGDADGAMIARVLRYSIERKRAELRIQNITRLYATLSEVNHTIVHVHSQSELIQTICKVSVDYGKFGLAWIGFVDIKTGEVTNIASHGTGKDLLNDQAFSIWQDPFKDSLIGFAVKTGKTAYSSKDIQADPTMQHWCEIALAGDYHSAAAVPFNLNGQILGILNLYATTVDFFTDEQQNNLLDEMGLDISFALDKMENESRRKQAEDSFRVSEERFFSAFEYAAIGMALVAPDGRWLQVNKALCEIVGYSKDELLEKTFQDITHLDDLAVDLKNVHQLLTGEIQTYQMEKRYIQKSGQFVWALLSVSLVRDSAGQPLHFISQIQDVTERKLAERELTRSNRFIGALNQVAAKVNASYNPEQVLETLGSGLKALGVESVVMLLESNRQSLNIKYTSLAPTALSRSEKILNLELLGSPIPYEHSSPKEIKEIIEKKRPLMLPNPIDFITVIFPGISRSIAERALRLAGVHIDVSVFNLPLVSNEQAIGVLVLWGSGLQKDDVPVLNVFASQVATAVEKARLYENIQQELVDRKEAEERISKNAARAETLGRLSQVLTESTQTIQAISDLVADYTASLMGGACLITQLSEDGQWLNPIAFSHPEPRAESLIGELLASRPYSVGDGIIGSVVQSGQPVLVSELPQEYFLTTFSPGHTLNLDRYGVFNLYVVPLRAQGGIIGTIGVARDKPIPSYTDDEQELLQEIADRAAMAILNARLYQDAQRRLKHIQALMTVDVAISGSFDLTITLEILLDQVTAQLGVDAANILRFDPQTEMLNFVAGRGFRTRALQHTHSRLGEGYAGTAALERKLVQVPDLRSRHTDFLRSPYFGAEAFVSYYAVPLIAKGQVMGVMELFHRSPLAQDEEWHHFLKAMAGQAAIALDNLSLFNDLQRSNTELIQAYNATIEGWSKALDLRDKETEGHTQRVTSMTVRLAQALGISRSEMAHIRRGALLHDIGKMGVPDRVLLKEGPLTEEEWVVMRNHPVLAHEWLSGIPFLRPALDIPYCHHERWDGTGYPRGLKGEQIPLAARIFAVVDVWDALTSNRPYRKAWTREKTLSHISEQAGSHFEPEVVNAFLMEIANDI